MALEAFTILRFPTKAPFSASFSGISLPTKPLKSKVIALARQSAGNGDLEVPARDRVINFGKHKGRMLGSLPSSYLKWVSRNLRAGDTEVWARLADEVLGDPVYRDRMEWELAESVLTGSSLRNTRSGDGGGAAAELEEISERFGWDEGDKLGWSRIDWRLLGTSMGGRIPRQKTEIAEVAKDEGGEERRRQRRQRRREMIDGKSSGGCDEHGGGGSSRFPGRETLLRRLGFHGDGSN